MLRSALLYKHEDGSTKPVVHVSRSLIAEEKYSEIGKDALAIIFVVNAFRSFYMEKDFYCRQTIGFCCLSMGLKKGLPAHTANRLQRWGVILLNYNFKMQYIPSKIIRSCGLPFKINSKKYVTTRRNFYSRTAGRN